MKVYLCEPTIEGLLTAVFFSYYNRETVRISSELGCVGANEEVVEIPADWAKAERVMSGIFKCDMSAPALISLAYCSSSSDHCELIHRYLRLLFAEKKPLREGFLHVPEVKQIYVTASKVEAEISRVRGAIRFRDTVNQVMYAQFTSEYNILGVVLPRLAHKFKTERILLHDLSHGVVGVFGGNSAHARLDTGEYQYADTYKSFLGRGADYYYRKPISSLPDQYAQADFYQAVWDEFFQSVSVPGNPTNGFTPIRYRWYSR